jgi:hypothetical protein
MYKRIKVELLEPDKNKNALSFCKEAQNIEFTQIIGKMDTSCCIGSNKRDEILAKMGKELLKSCKKYLKRKKFSIRIDKWTKVLSEQEIDELLTTVERKGILKILDKLKHIFDFKKYHWWEITIWYKNISYKIGFFKNKRAIAHTSNKYNGPGVFSQEEIDELLRAINDKEEKS